MTPREEARFLSRDVGGNQQAPVTKDAPMVLTPHWRPGGTFVRLLIAAAPLNPNKN